MDGNRFDEFTKALANLRSRRAVLRKLGLVTGAAVVTAIGLDESGVAAATCRPGGSVCRKHGDCCSGTCKPKDATGRKYCAAAAACTEPDDTACCPSCQVSPICCDGNCVGNNELNCGACGNTCAAGETCCPPFLVVVGDNISRECANLQTSEQHCGACRKRCSPTCDINGDRLTNGEICCGGQCTANDVSNCNGCGTVCPGPFTNATVTCVPPSCDGGTDPGGCFFQCNEGYVDCDEDYRNGCEFQIPPQSDTNCGCGAPCGGAIDCTVTGQICSNTRCCPPGNIYDYTDDGSGNPVGCRPEDPSNPLPEQSCGQFPGRGARYLR